MTELDLGSKPKVLTVTELNRLVRGRLEADFPNVWVQGEISQPNFHPSGHVYFKLKDKMSQIDAVLWRGDAARLKFRLEHGLEVVAHGRLTLYEARGGYQIVVRELQPKAMGALQLAFEQLKAKLEAEGLFDQARKRPLPPYPRTIGLITSRSGAAVRDMLAILRRRFPGLLVRLYPVAVQGEGAAAQIARAIAELNAHFPDTEVLLVGRGGGSLEDLWAFNEEAVARAIAGSRIPVISCVGHETDFTIADFVADLRAPTPSAAAELVVPEKAAVRERILSAARRLTGTLDSVLRRLEERLARLARSAALRRPERIFEQKAQRIDELAARLPPALARLVRACADRLQRAERLLPALENRIRHAEKDLREHAAKLDALSPLKVLGRGYAIAFKLPKRAVIRKASEVATFDEIEVRVGEGSFKARVE